MTGVYLNHRNGFVKASVYWTRGASVGRLREKDGYDANTIATGPAFCAFGHGIELGEVLRQNRIGGWDQVAEDNAVISLVPHLRADGGSLD